MENISVVMPLFNAEKYLPEALQSVLNQTYKDFELICINDCSTDDTVKILTHFQQKDRRIKILGNKKRLGAGFSRNIGLVAAKGKYVIFLDGDDIFEESLLEKAYITMESSLADIVIFEFSPHTPSELLYIKKEVQRSKIFVEKYCKKTFSVKDFEPWEFLGLSDAPWNKMFRKKFIEENELYFQDLPSSNDVYFSKMALCCADKIIWMDDRRVMVYEREHSEPSRISNDRNPMCAYYAMEKWAKELCKRNMFAALADLYFYALISIVRYLLRQEKDEKRRESFFAFLKREGIFRCVEYGKDYYGQVDAYVKYWLDNFQNNSYESEWFEQADTYFQFYLKRNGDRVCEFITNQTLKDKKIVLWGIGVNGNILLDYLREHSTGIYGIVDCDKEKQGTITCGYEILDPAAVVQKADYVIVTSRQLSCELCDTDIIKNTGTVVVNLLELMKEERVSR